MINGEPRLFLQPGSFKKQKLFQMKERTPSGCIASTLKLAFLAGVIITIWMLWSCKTQEGCWKGAEPKFRYDKKFNK